MYYLQKIVPYIKMPITSPLLVSKVKIGVPDMLRTCTTSYQIRLDNLRLGVDQFDSLPYMLVRLLFNHWGTSRHLQPHSFFGIAISISVFSIFSLALRNALHLDPPTPIFFVTHRNKNDDNHPPTLRYVFFERPLSLLQKLQTDVY